MTAKGHTLIDRELSLPLKWIQDRERCQEANIPDTVRFQTKCELARQMIERVHHAHIPLSWVVADTVYGSNQARLTWLQANHYSYVLAVACSEPIGIQTPDGRKLVEVRDVEALLLHAQDWQRLSMSQGTKGPRIFDWTAVPILHKWEDDGHHWLLIRRCVDDPSKKTYYLVFAPKGTTWQEMVEAIGARWYIEQDFETSKDMGLDQYEVRSWTGWYRHVTGVLLAHANFPTICSQDKAPVFATSSTLSTLDTSSTLPVLGVAPLTVVSRASSAWTSHLAASL